MIGRALDILEAVGHWISTFNFLSWSLNLDSLPTPFPSNHHWVGDAHTHVGTHDPRGTPGVLSEKMKPKDALRIASTDPMPQAEAGAVP